eukprot:5760118-Prymnesium_polylepis.1
MVLFFVPLLCSPLGVTLPRESWPSRVGPADVDLAARARHTGSGPAGSWAARVREATPWVGECSLGTRTGGRFVVSSIERARKIALN